ncbi:hypothetical protein EAX62_07510 [Tessaracoccus antarcticus]|uniref:Uncharacterized protein n=2 Tax=Tessaracoccus antarcticus TaxID=2479848 RepID=A0A3M0G4W4_9ACTN|nr:hypothetical protein EAX62_07510 [Tessaracoccus antarcticus]
MGPTYAGGSQPIIKDGYSILYLPDVNNRELIAAGESPVYYYIPNQVRMARKEGPDKGDYLFNMLRFAGTGGEGVIGGGGDVAGGVLTFSVTGDLPATTREQAEEQITEQVMGSTDSFWGAAGSRKPPLFRPAIIAASTTSVSNVAPTPRGFPAMPTGTRSTTGSDITYTGAPPAPGRRARDGDPAAGGDPAPTGGDNNLDPWYWLMQGQGAGSIDPSGTHAFSGLLGSYPAAICWAAFQGTASPLIVMQNYKLKVWSPVVTVKIHGHWEKIFTHFSAAASGRYLWASVDLKAEFNKMKTDGTITVETLVDTTLPDADKIAERLQERTDLVFSKFMEQAQKVIFDPPQPQVEAAQASSGGLTPWGAGVALKYRRDETQLDLTYEETSQFAYLQDHTISSSLAGMFDEMHADPEAERKYFQTVYLDDWPRRLARVLRPVAAWADGAVEFLSVQVGYPNTQGAINWEGHSFSGSDGNDGTWKFQTAQKQASDVTNAPTGWTPDMTWVKRKVHLAEPPSDIQDPYHRIQIERNVIDLDPGPNGTLLNDTTLEVRADSAGRLAVGPIQLGVMLTDNSQVVEAVFEATDETGEPAGMPQVRFRWNHGDVDVDRTWAIFTGDPAFRPFYRYQVSVTVKGTLFEPGRAWSGGWVRTSGNGPIIVDIPRPDQPGVTVRSVPEDRIRGLRALAAPREGQLPAPAAPAAESAVNGTRGGPDASTVLRFRNYQV